MKNSTARVSSIDMVRGLVMVIMALDHSRDLFHVDVFSYDALNLQRTTPLLFITRWVTHLCAPAFVFLSGVSAYLSFTRSNNLRETRAFLLTRGLWLIFLEFTVISFGIWADVKFSVFMFQVIAAIGVGFLWLAPLLPFRPIAIAIGALVFILLLNAAAIPPFVYEGILTAVPQPVLALVSPQVIPSASTTYLITYPPLIWASVLLLGFGSAPALLSSKRPRMRTFLYVGTLLVGLFVVVRFLNGYGDVAPWSQQSTPLYTFLSFLNVTKYPPTFQYLLVFLGWMFLALAFFEVKQVAVLRVFGRVPLFYYIVHWYLLHSALFLLLFYQGFSFSDFTFGFRFGRPEAPSGLGLGGVYLVWLSVVILLYPLCRWYEKYKFAHPEKKWLRYL